MCGVHAPVSDSWVSALNVLLDMKILGVDAECLPVCGSVGYGFTCGFEAPVSDAWASTLNVALEMKPSVVNAECLPICGGARYGVRVQPTSPSIGPCDLFSE